MHFYKYLTRLDPEWFICNRLIPMGNILIPRISPLHEVPGEGDLCLLQGHLAQLHDVSCKCHGNMEATQGSVAVGTQQTSI